MDIRKLILGAAFPIPHMAEEDGGSGGADTALMSADDEIIAEDEESFLQQFAMKDEEYRQLAKQDEEEEGGGGRKEDEEQDDDARRQSPTDKKKDKPSKDDEPPAEDEDHAGDAPEKAPKKAAEDDVWFDEEANKEYVFKDGRWQDADALGGKKGDDAREERHEIEDEDFVDDVIPGLKGKDFASLSQDSQAAIATFYDEARKTKENHEKINRTWEALSKDPVTQQRIKLIENGQALDSYALPEVEDKDVEAVLESKNREDAKKAFERAIKKYGQTVADNTRIEIHRENAAKEINRKGEQIILEAANMHPDCKHKITSLANVSMPDHPDRNTYDTYTTKVIEYCRKRGWRYDKISEYEPAELYALVAIKNRWPIVQNAEERDRKLIQEKVNAALQHFRRSRGSEFARGMRQSGSESHEKPGDRGTVRKNGIDIVKLARDDDYHDKVMKMKPMDSDWIDKVAELRMEGEAILERRQPRKNRTQTGA